MVSGRVQKCRIEIPVPFKPRPYRPGDGPGLAPITLALKKDSDAFIVDKHVQPGKPVHGEVKLEMYYVIGWPDLPAGRVVINARHIYDYVSPRTLEDFEYKLSLEREEEELKQEAEQAKRKAEAAAAKAQAMAKAAAAKPETPSSLPSSASATPKTAKAPTLITTGKKKRGRPSKADLLARQMVQQTSVDETAEVALPSISMSGPSLSTPQKKQRTAAGAAVVSEIDTDMQEEAEEEEEEDGGWEEEDEADPDDAIFRQLYSEASAFNRSVEKADVEKALEKEMPLRTAPQAPSPSHKPANNKSKHSTPPHSQLEAQIPQNGLASVPQTAPVQKTTLQHYGFTPAARSSGKWPSPRPHLPSAETPRSDTQQTAAKAVEPNAIGGGGAAAAGPETPTSNKGAKPPRKRKRTKSEATGQVEEPLWEVKRLEDDRVEEAEDGTRTPFFKVRWKGNWPPDQNPTWEPEENIPRKLIKEYLRRKSRKNDKSAGSSSRNSPSVTGEIRHTPKTMAKRPALLVRKYSSVSEVFEGALEEADGQPSGTASSTRSRGAWREDDHDEDIQVHDNADDDDDDYNDEAVDQLVVTEPQQQSPRRQPRRQREDGFTSPFASASALSLPSLPSLPTTQFHATLARELPASFGGSVGHQPHHQQPQHRESSEP